MNYIIYFLIGLVIGIGIMIFVTARKMKAIQNLAPETEDEVKKKENIAKIEAYIANKDRFTNDDLQGLLGISNTTVKRYLDELEEQGKIKQIGRIGSGVYYTKI